MSFSKAPNASDRMVTLKFLARGKEFKVEKPHSEIMTEYRKEDCLFSIEVSPSQHLCMHREIFRQTAFIVGGRAMDIDTIIFHERGYVFPIYTSREEGLADFRKYIKKALGLEQAVNSYMMNYAESTDKDIAEETAVVVWKQFCEIRQSENDTRFLAVQDQKAQPSMPKLPVAIQGQESALQPVLIKGTVKGEEKEVGADTQIEFNIFIGKESVASGIISLYDDIQRSPSLIFFPSDDGRYVGVPKVYLLQQIKECMQNGIREIALTDKGFSLPIYQDYQQGGQEFTLYGVNNQCDGNNDIATWIKFCNHRYNVMKDPRYARMASLMTPAAEKKDQKDHEAAIRPVAEKKPQLPVEIQRMVKEHLSSEPKQDSKNSSHITIAGRYYGLGIEGEYKVIFDAQNDEWFSSFARFELKEKGVAIFIPLFEIEKFTKSPENHGKVMSNFFAIALPIHRELEVVIQAELNAILETKPNEQVKTSTPANSEFLFCDLTNAQAATLNTNAINTIPADGFNESAAVNSYQISLSSIYYALRMRYLFSKKMAEDKQSQNAVLSAEKPKDDENFTMNIHVFGISMVLKITYEKMKQQLESCEMFFIKDSSSDNHICIPSFLVRQQMEACIKNGSREIDVAERNFRFPIFANQAECESAFIKFKQESYLMVHNHGRHDRALEKGCLDLYKWTMFCQAQFFSGDPRFVKDRAKKYVKEHKAPQQTVQSSKKVMTVNFQFGSNRYTAKFNKEALKEKLKEAKLQTIGTTAKEDPNLEWHFAVDELKAELQKHGDQYPNVLEWKGELHRKSKAQNRFLEPNEVPISLAPRPTSIVPEYQFQMPGTEAKNDVVQIRKPFDATALCVAQHISQFPAELKFIPQPCWGSYSRFSVQSEDKNKTHAVFMPTEAAIAFNKKTNNAPGYHLALALPEYQEIEIVLRKELNKLLGVNNIEIMIPNNSDYLLCALDQNQAAQLREKGIDVTPDQGKLYQVNLGKLHKCIVEEWTKLPKNKVEKKAENSSTNYQLVVYVKGTEVRRKYQLAELEKLLHDSPVFSIKISDIKYLCLPTNLVRQRLEACRKDFKNEIHLAEREHCFPLYPNLAECEKDFRQFCAVDLPKMRGMAKRRHIDFDKAPNTDDWTLFCRHMAIRPDEKNHKLFLRTDDRQIFVNQMAMISLHEEQNKAEAKAAQAEPKKQKSKKPVEAKDQPQPLKHDVQPVAVVPEEPKQEQPKQAQPKKSKRRNRPQLSEEERGKAELARQEKRAKAERAAKEAAEKAEAERKAAEEAKKAKELKKKSDRLARRQAADAKAQAEKAAAEKVAAAKLKEDQEANKTRGKNGLMPMFSIPSSPGVKQQPAQSEVKDAPAKILSAKEKEEQEANKTRGKDGLRPALPIPLSQLANQQPSHSGAVIMKGLGISKIEPQQVQPPASPKDKVPAQEVQADAPAPDQKKDEISPFECPITLEIMEDPVICTLDGNTYERKAIKAALEKNKRTPTNVDLPPNQAIDHTILVPNRLVKSLIENLNKQKPQNTIKASP